MAEDLADAMEGALGGIGDDDDDNYNFETDFQT